MAITKKMVMPEQRSSKPYNTYHGLTGKSSLGGKRVLKHPKGSMRKKGRGKKGGRR